MTFRIADLYSGAGGAAFGLWQACQDAGIDCEITGVDIRPQKHYPFRFVEGDALTFPLDGFDFVWASPPCQAHTSLRWMWNAKPHLDLLTPTRARLLAWGGPFIIENVPGAPMRDYLTLCGTMFGLGVSRPRGEVRRHRQFETCGFTAPLIPRCQHRLPAVGIYGGTQGGRKNYHPHLPRFHAAHRREALGIDWMTRDELSQAIPPAYSRYILGAYLQQRQAVA